MQFLDLGWLNKSADIYVCAQCGLLHWFLEPNVGLGQEPKEVAPEELATEDDLAEPTECLECRQTIPAGWSYQSS
jgi:hypothetical protein